MVEKDIINISKNRMEEALTEAFLDENKEIFMTTSSIDAANKIKNMTKDDHGARIVWLVHDNIFFIADSFDMYHEDIVSNIVEAGYLDNYITKYNLPKRPIAGYADTLVYYDIALMLQSCTESFIGEDLYNEEFKFDFGYIVVRNDDKQLFKTSSLCRQLGEIKAHKIIKNYEEFLNGTAEELEIINIDEDLKDDAKAHFGTTTRWKSCFYINTDGTMLDGSGAKFGARGSNMRTLDHRDIADIIPEGAEGTEAMLAYMAEGNIRFQPEARGFEIMKKPTYEQYETLEKMITDFDDEVNIDIVAENGDVKESFFHDWDEPASKILAQVKRYFVNNETLLEDTRNQLIAKSRNADQYKNTKFGKNRFERKRLSKMANTVKSFNKIDMNTFFKQDTLEVVVPVTGETSSYDVTIRMEGVCTEIAKNIKNNNNVLEFKTILQALTKVFNTANIYVKCSCKDFTYRYAHQLIINNNSVDGTSADPGPGKTGMANTQGKGCKHVLLVLNNLEWMMKVASVVNNYINYAAEKMQKAFLQIIFPKLYGVEASGAEDAGLVPEDTNLETEKHIIDLINDYGRNRGKYQKGSNKNPITGTGGKTKKEEENN